MAKSVTRNYLYNVIYQVLALITPFITTPYISRVLGASGIGIYSYTFSIVTYFVILGSLGIADYAQREIAYNRDNPKRQSKVFFEMFLLRIITTAVSLILYYWFVSVKFDDKSMYYLQALNIVSLLFDISWFFQGLEEFGKIILRNIIVRIFNVVLILSFIRRADDLYLYIFLMGIMNIIGGISMFPYLRRHLCGFDIRGFKPFHDFRVIIQMFLPQIAIQMYTVLDKTMLGVITGSSLENGYYEQAEKIAKIPLTIVTALGIVMLPRISYLYANHDYEKLKWYMMRSYRFVWFLGIPLMFGIMGIAENALPWFLGQGFDESVILLQVFSVLIIAIGLSNVTGIQYMVPTNQQNKLSITLLAGAAFNFVMNLFMIQHYMALGAAITSVITEVLITVMQFIFVRKFFSIEDIIKMSAKYFAAGVIMFVGIYMMGRSLLPVFRNTVFLVMFGAVLYLGILYWMKDKFFLGMCCKIRDKYRIFICKRF
ncbi:flippase [Pectinatus haikarae]|uniref:flippase n=1 Tax=Pectinatus haikarae TaxID=349096 RepID=UPI0018C6C99B|nr:flippase [Pectinatus haikarae]